MTLESFKNPHEGLLHVTNIAANEKDYKGSMKFCVNLGIAVVQIEKCELSRIISLKYRCKQTSKREKVSDVAEVRVLHVLFENAPINQLWNPVCDADM